MWRAAVGHGPYLPGGGGAPDEVAGGSYGTTDELRVGFIQFAETKDFFNCRLQSKPTCHGLNCVPKFIRWSPNPQWGYVWKEGHRERTLQRAVHSRPLRCLFVTAGAPSQLTDSVLVTFAPGTAARTKASGDLSVSRAPPPSRTN